MTRLLLIITALGLAASSPAQQAFLDQLAPFYNPASKPFYHGVASGDPTSGSVIIWTKVTPDRPDEIEVQWEMSMDSLFTKVFKKGGVQTGLDQNWTVHVDVTGLQPATYYYYRFIYAGQKSRVGRTRTAPTGQVERLRLAMVSCSNYEAGFFNAYGNLARRDDIEAVIHLGDYIYEYKSGGYGNSKLPRKNIPAHEIVKLDDYRARYSLYRLDPDLQALHARHPFITIWDDHEFANDAYTGGAQNHQPDGEGPWEARKAAAQKAYFEWLPVRRGSRGELYRNFRYGNLAELWMLDGRLAGRSKQAKSAQDPAFASEERTMLGSDQFEWLTQGMAQSDAVWRILGNQVFMSSVDASKVFKDNPKFMDMWDGYPAERNRLFQFFESQQMKNIIVVTGDSHTSWAFELTRNPHNKADYNSKTGKGVVGVEYCTPSVTSANYDEYVSRLKVKLGQRRFSKGGINPHTRYRDLINHGYMILTLDRQSASAEWRHMKTVKSPTRKERPAVKRVYRTGQGIAKS
ncbi:MAG: alkaline phosphatase D family protein [Saprospiraceae bacterium]